ncbi:hypothetical protein NC653_004843 [Populus alba x Populus x berolinensis]|uniref:Uncharacterized protein n=1 Tax=Populus alba x Populus x berolinensis TaxID=444605 RepID=A0AAD6RVG1_9ROSI|nr:hypothetical protein NC653_004843 [Populus alba x Populus x berolinensis]
MENVGKFAFLEDWDQRSPISILEVHHVGRSRYILSLDIRGMIRVFRENGTVYGSAMPTSRPLAFLKQRLLFLTERRCWVIGFAEHEKSENLNVKVWTILLLGIMFLMPPNGPKAYGFTSEGELIQVLLLGDIMNFKCRVRSKRKFDMEEPLALQPIKGYLFVVNEEKVFVYNVSSQHYVRVRGPRLVFSAGLDEIKSSFLNYQVTSAPIERRRAMPLIASDREKIVVLGLGSGYVGMYRSNLPIFKGEFNTMLWTSPVLFFVLFLFGAWQFFAKKKEALTSWGPDDPFSSTSATIGAPVGSSASADRSYVDSSSRSTDRMELRAGGLIGPSRRYPSPPRFPGGGNQFLQARFC